MSRKAMTGAVLVAMLGVVCQFGSCLTRGLMATATHVGLDFILDNDQVFDLFED